VVTDVGRSSDDGTGQRGCGLDGGAEPSTVAACNDYVIALRGECQRDRATDSGPTTGDDDATRGQNFGHPVTS
jgi:hypothetical protein